MIYLFKEMFQGLILLRQESLVSRLLCIFESPRLVALFNSMRTDETALYNLHKVVYAYLFHIDEFSRAWQIF